VSGHEARNDAQRLSDEDTDTHKLDDVSHEEELDELEEDEEDEEDEDEVPCR